MIDSIRKEISYCSSSGEFKWLKTGRGRRKLPGYFGSGGYILIRVLGVVYRAHRLAWYMHYGEWPDAQIDHIDGRPANNAISNLRLASSSENNRNASLRSDNKSGVKGVSWKIREQRWAVQISVNRKNITIGYFKELEKAKMAYADASKKYHGEFGKAVCR